MFRYIVRRILAMLPVLFLVSVIVFSLIHLTPGDPAITMLGEEATPEAVAALRAKLGLDQPLPVQYLRWVGSVLQGDLGRSIRSNQPVSEAIAQRLPVTLELAILSVLIGVAIAIPVGIVSAMRRNSPLDTASTGAALLGVSLPNFFLAILLIFIFSVHLRWLPPIGYTPLADGVLDNLKRMLMPAITLGTALSAIVMRMTRSSLLEVLDQDYVRTARAKGLAEMRVIRVHALKNSLIPVATVVGLQIGGLLGGAIITETIFALPGIGRLLVDSIFQRDFPLVQGVVLFTSLAFLVVNLLVDLLYAFLDPRIRYS
ncbi:nickel ABC transporter permease [Sphaerobacter thermophilus]|uniref:Binding-protein-dependent transport systems inner membrane component n=1 Tax=Sphaerobacter thermophilus (strain ATCC 49802 / DSM 20745 / KCCM 41009 / NCIMB 13125 / S 6022) TaxID=479434 RepID=D1C1J9_SPHTD|nr:nickel ABC transporter permease [Sphaerobacter thermophilus]ACZ38116.1 binding-protein-dependent transport systems inner membrane component [Sphaerobacter thermophilus DSM 20745]